MKNLLLTLTAFSLCFFWVTPVFAYNGGYRNQYYQQSGYCPVERLNRLNLSDEQKTKIKKMQFIHEKEIQPISEKIFDKSVALQHLWLTQNPDRNQINAAQKEVRTLRDQLEDKKTAYRFEVTKILTSEQKEKWANYSCGKSSGFGPRGRMMGHGYGYNKYVPGMEMR